MVFIIDVSFGLKKVFLTENSLSLLPMRAEMQVGCSVQRATHAADVVASTANKYNCLLRATGDVGLLGTCFRNHLGFLVSHFRLLSEGFPQFVIFGGENRFLPHYR